MTVSADGRTIDDIFQEVLERYVRYSTDEMSRFDLDSMANSLFKDEWLVNTSLYIILNPTFG